MFNYPFTISKPGRYIIPAISFSYFDISTHNYKTLLTSPVTIEVKKGLGVRPAIPSQLKSLANATHESLGSKFFNWRWLLLIAAFIIAGLIVWFTGKPGKKASLLTSTSNKNIIEDGIEPGEKDEVQIPKDHLHEAETMLLENNTNNFYYTLNNGLRNFLSDKLNFPEKELTKKKINELLDKYNVGVSTTLMLLSLLENIEVNLYAPVSSANQMEEVYQKASEVVSLLDKQIS